MGVGGRGESYIAIYHTVRDVYRDGKLVKMIATTNAVHCTKINVTLPTPFFDPRRNKLNS